MSIGSYLDMNNFGNFDRISDPATCKQEICLFDVQSYQYYAEPYCEMR